MITWLRKLVYLSSASNKASLTPLVIPGVKRRKIFNLKFVSTMKKIFTILASAALALTMSSCVKDTTVDEGMKGGVVRTIGANIEAMTRTSMDDFEPGESAQVVWSEGDIIGIATSAGTIRQAVLTEGAGTPTGEFEIKEGQDADVYEYAFYPYNKNVTYSGNGTFEHMPLDAKRQFITNPTAGDPTLPDNGLTFATNQLPMTATLNESGVFAFKSICGIIEVQLLGVQSYEELNDETSEPEDKPWRFYHIGLQSDACRLSGYGTVNAAAAEPTFVPYPYTSYSNTKISAKEYSTNLAYMGGADNNNQDINFNPDTPTSLFFVVPIGTYPDLKIQVGTPKLCVHKISTQSHEVKRNTILRFKPFNVNEIDDIYKGGDVVDLSVDPSGNPEYAFTYLAKEGVYPKKYKFTAKMVGDTKTFKLPNGTTYSTETAGNYNTTYVFAEDTEGVITNVRREGDIVYFTANKPGNAIVCVGASNGGIINQWHIWVSDVKEQVLPGGHVFLDRDMGATYAPKSVSEAGSMSREQVWRAAGCHYQWGNPIPRASVTEAYLPADFNTTSVNGAANEWKERHWPLHKWVNDGYKIYAFSSASDAADLYRTRNYFNYFTQASTTTSNSYYGLWWINDMVNMTASKGKYPDGFVDLRWGKNALWQKNKTQFDPCPPGYRVPSKQEIADVLTNVGEHTTKKFYTAPNSGGQYYEYNGQLIFLSWSGFSQANNSALFNTMCSNYPRAGWWFFDPNITSGEELEAQTPSLQYGTQGGSWRYNTDSHTVDGEKVTPGSSTDAVFRNCTHEMVELRGGGTDWWKTNSAKTITGQVPNFHGYRYFVAMGANVRCVRAVSDIMNDAQGPAFEVDTPTDF